MTKYIVAGVFLIGGVYFVRKILNGKNTEKEKPNVEDFITEKQTLVFGGEKCPISEKTIEEERKKRQMRISMNPLHSLMGGRTYTAPQYPFSWNELCTKKQISDFQTSLQDGVKTLKDIANRGLMPPMLSPQAMIKIAKEFGKETGAFDPNKDYSIFCGTEMCWKWNGSKWVKKV